jgi:hypothetical protein
MSEHVLKACKELIDDTKVGCVDLVFKEVCLGVLSRAHNVLSEKQFEQLVMCVTEKMKEKASFGTQPELTIQR